MIVKKSSVASVFMACLFLLTLAGVSVLSAPVKTRIVDHVVDTSGNGRKGKVTFILTQKSATSPGGIIPVGATVSAATDTSGRFDISVYPSASLSPTSYYQVYFTDGTTNGQTLIGVYNVPASDGVITLAPYKVIDTNLSAQYTFASMADVLALTSTVATETLSQLTGISHVNNKVQVYRSVSGTFVDGSITDTGSAVTVGVPVSVTGTLSTTGSVTVGGSQTVAGSLTVTGAVAGSSFTGSGAGLTNLPTGVVTPSTLASTGSVGLNADTDNDTVGIITQSINSVVAQRVNNDRTTDLVGGLAPSTTAGLPACPCSPGRILRVSDVQKGLYVTDGNTWFPIVDEVQVKWFGAKGDGSTDDAAALQAAINSLPGGGMVKLGAGTFRVDTPLTFPASKRTLLVGIGAGRTVVKSGGATAAVINGSSTYDYTEFYSGVRDLTLDGNGLAGDIVTFSKMTLLNLENLNIRSATGTGLKLISIRDGHYSNIYVEDSGDATNAMVVFDAINVADNGFNNNQFYNLHIETADTDTTLLEMKCNVNSVCDSTYLYGLKTHGNPFSGNPNRPLIKLSQYTSQNKFFGGIVAFGHGSAQIEDGGNLNSYYEQVFGYKAGTAPANAFHLTSTSARISIVRPTFNNATYSTGYIWNEGSENLLKDPYAGAGPALVTGNTMATTRSSLLAETPVAVLPASTGSAVPDGLPARVCGATQCLDFGVDPSTPFGFVMRAHDKASQGTSYPLALNDAGGNVGIGTRSPKTVLDVRGGNVYAGTAGNGLVLKSPDGTVCRVITIDNAGALTNTSITCP